MDGHLWQMDLLVHHRLLSSEQSFYFWQAIAINLGTFVYMSIFDAESYILCQGVKLILESFLYLLLLYFIPIHLNNLANTTIILIIEQTKCKNCIVYIKSSALYKTIGKLDI